jgi:two-component system, cell cycle response regulator DivK
LVVRNEVTILLAEDFVETRTMIRWWLEMNGYKVVEAVTGNQALELAKARLPSLILMDISLPGMDGLSAARLIHEQAELKSVPIVIVSAYDSPGFRSAAETVGCLEYLKKPIDFDQLEIIIDRLLPGKQRSVARRA